MPVDHLVMIICKLSNKWWWKSKCQLSTSSFRQEIRTSSWIKPRLSCWWSQGWRVSTTTKDSLPGFDYSSVVGHTSPHMQSFQSHKRLVTRWHAKIVATWSNWWGCLPLVVDSYSWWSFDWGLSSKLSRMILLFKTDQNSWVAQLPSCNRSVDDLNQLVAHTSFVKTA